MFKNPLFILGTCLLSALPVSAVHHSQEAVGAFNKGVTAFNQHNCTDAVPFFDQALAADPTLSDAFYARGACKQSDGNTEGAVADLSDAIRLNPSLVDAHGLRGALYFQQGNYDQASEDFDQVLAAKPSDAQCLIGRGAIALKTGKVASARRDFSAFLKYHPHDAFAPKVHEILTALKGAPQGASSEETASAPPSSGGTRHANHADTSLAKAQSLSASFFSEHKTASDDFGQKVLSGGQPQATGNFDPSK